MGKKEQYSGLKRRAPGDNMVTCPHPDCDHVGALITKAHCRIHHEMERDELFKKYGEPISLTLDRRKVKENIKLHRPAYHKSGSDDTK